MIYSMKWNVQSLMDKSCYMKYLIISILGCMIGYGYGYIKGYVNGYDEAKECYTSYYNTILNKIYDYEKERTPNVE